MYGIIVSVIIVLALLLVLVILAQNPKGGGLSSQFGGSGATQVMGVKKTGDILEKLTWGFAVAIFALALLTNFFIEEPGQDFTSPNIDRASQSAQPVMPSIQEDPTGNEAAPLEELQLDDTTGQ
jgi:preprotein translocase subunit SecG